jgi:hypothetical protein
VPELTATLHTEGGEIPPSDGSLTSLAVQSVLYQHGLEEVERMIQGIGNAVRVAKQNGKVGPVSLILGDCSPAPTLTQKDLVRIKEQIEPWGVVEVTYDFFEANLGSAAGHNRLLGVTSSPYVLILNPDTFASPFMLMELALPFGDPRMGICESRQIPLEHPKEFNSYSGDTSWASTAGCLVRRQLIDEIGGFDSDSFFLYCDDVDFSWRARLAGYRVVLQPTARLFHDKRLTTGGTMIVGDAEVYYAAEAALMLAWKYSRPDLAESWAASLLDASNPLQVQAAQRFRARMAEGTLPEPIDPEGSVAQFVGLDFARHRFTYGD